MQYGMRPDVQYSLYSVRFVVCFVCPPLLCAALSSSVKYSTLLNNSALLCTAKVGCGMVGQGGLDSTE